MQSVPLPRTSAPALSALQAAGFDDLGSLNGVPMRDVLALHGVGPRAIRALREAMRDHGWALADDDPTVGALPGGVVPGAKGKGRNDNATAVTGVSPEAWIEGLPKPRQVEQGRAMLKLFGEVTGESPAMWGPSMVGYGQQHYVYESGREGDSMRTGFSPRAANLVLYVVSPGVDELLAKLGPHKRGVSCLYLTRLDQVDHEVLRQLVRNAWES